MIYILHRARAVKGKIPYKLTKLSCQYYSFIFEMFYRLYELEKQHLAQHLLLFI